MTELLRTGRSDDARVLGEDSWSNAVADKFVPHKDTIELDELIRRICQRRDVTVKELCSPSRERRLTEIRAEIALVASENGIATISEVARLFGRSQPVISRSVWRLKKALEQDIKL